MAQQQEKHFHMQMFINKTLDFKTSNVLFSFYNYTILTQNKPTELQQQQQHTYYTHTYIRTTTTDIIYKIWLKKISKIK